VNAVVTGGGGFLGRRVVELLRERGDEVVVVGRSDYPEVAATGARCVRWDLAEDRLGLAEVFAGADTVFHVAALPGVWGGKERYWGVNVHGTQRVIDACRDAGVGRLVYTGSPSCTFDGRHHEGVSERDCPYPERFECHYPASKAEAERRVLAANADQLATVSLRPHLIYGPRDPHLLPRVLDRHASGRLRIVGDGLNRVGVTYVDNAAWAHLQAADALAHGSCAGNAYFVTDPEPVAIWAWLNTILDRLGRAPLTRRVPLGAARAVGAALEGIWWAFSLSGEPPMTRFVASQLATSHHYDLSGAVGDCGYAPPVSAEQALERTVADLRARFG